jgi:ABC-2 type transport system permease protein
VSLCIILLIGTGLFAGILAYYGDPDWGVVLTGYLGLLLCCMAFVAGGMFASSLTDEPVAAGLGGVLLMMPFWLAGQASGLVTNETARILLNEVAVRTHVEPFSRGVIDTAHLAWFALFTFAFLFLTWRSVESRRWR